MKLTMTNKINDFNSQADPYVIRTQEGKFVIYVSGFDGVSAYESDTLAGEYQYKGIVFSVEGCKEYWAPSVIYTHGKYYMYVSFMKNNEDDAHLQTMHVACCETATGKFGNAKKLIEPFSIDSHVVENESGLYIFYSVNDYEAQRAGTYVVVDKMKNPEEVEGNPVAVVKPTLDEEIFQRDRFKKGQHWHTLEGAYYFKEGDWNYVIYSGNCYQNEYYYLGYASAKSNESDLTKIKFTKYPNENTYAPLISKNEFETGTGHNSVIKVDGKYYAVYHGRDIGVDASVPFDTRTARICELKVADGTITAVRYPDKI